MDPAKAKHPELRHISDGHLAIYRRLYGPVVHELQQRDKARPAGAAPRPISARWLAERFNLPGNKIEGRRRRAREMMLVLAVAADLPIAATHEGYYLATRPEDFAAQREWRRKQGLGHMIAAGRARHHDQADQSAGQLTFGLAAEPARPRYTAQVER